MHDIHIRLATINEAEGIAEILFKAFEEYKPLYTPEGFAATTPSADQILARRNEGPVWVAEVQNNLVGTIAAVPRGKALYLRSMGVLPSARGYGAGQRLMEQAEHFAREQHYRRIFFSTTPFLQSAIQLYERCGFQRTDEGPHDLFGTPLFTMEKILL